ncbi:hypothetical protein K431DRAFT_108056 [Polychaeton citri CBS 116435]|uniref:Uncharacterized protein n=1 Tax=Polychaeton citri CBS 116435 TaxID=1314669 RepID=A0A9P4UNE3_9PEZI|nr:hypothetical protein K431DRAFT_108056 [Polychaeton citri CBS 116435]
MPPREPPCLEHLCPQGAANVQHSHFQMGSTRAMLASSRKLDPDLRHLIGRDACCLPRVRPAAYYLLQASVRGRGLQLAAAAWLSLTVAAYIQHVLNRSILYRQTHHITRLPDDSTRQRSRGYTQDAVEQSRADALARRGTQ